MVSSALYRRAIPSGAKIEHWTAADGWTLRCFVWPVTEGPVRGSILFQGGRGDIFEKYLELFAHWHDRGWTITSFDWRGQGGSGRMTDNPNCGHIDDFNIYIDDLRAFWSEWKSETPGPHILMGHSMGGHLVMRALVEEAVDPQAAVLVAPMLGLKSPIGAGMGERLAKILGGVGNSARPAWKGNEKPHTTETRENLLTHDPDRYADEIWWQEAKPELLMGPPSWRWLIEAFRSTREVRKSPKLSQVTTPVLMLVADADQLVEPKAAHAIGAKLPDARIVRFGKEAAHELLRETDAIRNRAIGEIDLFLNSRAQAE